VSEDIRLHWVLL